MTTNIHEATRQAVESLKKTDMYLEAYPVLRVDDPDAIALFLQRYDNHDLRVQEM